MALEKKDVSKTTPEKTPSISKNVQPNIIIPPVAQQKDEIQNDYRLSEKEKSELESLETTIKKNINSFMDVGSALIVIRDKKLYRETFSTFEEYVHKKWDISKPRSYQLIKATEAKNNLSTIVDPSISFNESQLRPLAGLPPDSQRNAWMRAARKAHGGRVTSQHTRQAVRRLFPKETAKKPDGKVSPDFKTAFKLLGEEIYKAKKENWVTTSKEEALRHIAILRREITENPPN